MLPTKGYFQDIECPYFNSSCGRPYCHFRHRKKQSDYAEEVFNEPEKESPVVPTYKPTPKSELANIHNSKSHIPISYVPDLTFRPDRKSRPTPKFEKPTYKPTPLSILSSANKRGKSISEENGEHLEAIKEIKQNIANVEYDPTISLQSSTDIDFEDLSIEFDLIDEIINSNDKVSKHTDETELYDPSQVSLDINNRELSETNQDRKEIHVHDESINKNCSKTTRSDDNVEVESVPGKSSDHSEIGFSSVREKSQAKLDKCDRTSSDDSKHKNKSVDKEKKLQKEERHEKKDESSKKKEKKREKKEEKCEKKEEKQDKKESSKTSDRSHKKKQERNISSNSSENKSKEKGKEEKHVKSKHEREEKPKVSLKIDKNIKKNDHKSRKEERHSSSKEKQKSKEEDKIKSDRSKDRRERSESKDNRSSKSRDKHKHDKNPSKSIEKSKGDHENIKHTPSTSKEKIGSREEKAKKSITKHHRSDKHERSYSKNHEKLSKSHNSYKNLDETSNESEDDETEFVSLDHSGSVSPDSVSDNDETMLECYRIFNEYKPPRNTNSEKVEADISVPIHDDSVGKKRIAHANIQQAQSYQKLFLPTKPKAISTPGQTLANRYKIAQAAQASKEQELLMNEMQVTRPSKRPAPSLLEAARERKIRRETSQQSQAESSSLVDDILKGTSKTTCSQLKIVTRIAPAQNVMLMAKAKERISKIKQTVTVKTVAQTQKGNRTAHIPDVSLSDIPDVLQADKSKLPVNVRTRFLTMIADECVKLYISKEEAYSRALNEEYSCYEKCKVLTTYRNSAMLAVNRLRKEIQERNKNGLGLIGLGEPSDNNSSSGRRAQAFYNQVKRWLLTEEELDLHGYPRLSEEHHGRAIIKNVKNPLPQNLDENQRICVRCHKLYHVDDDGWPLYEEECCYHPLRKRTIRGEQTYLCCRSNDASGCATSDTHVSEATSSAELEGVQTTLDPEYEDDVRSYAVYALDCEMCYTTKGLELTRVTVVDTDCKTVYESLVKPLNPIIDYNTRFSGITKDQMDKTSTSILQIQANILHLCNSKTILVGHSLESDMKALKIVHSSVIDTSVLFPHKMGLPHKRALKVLASEYLRKIIQNDVSGHDSAEDAITCMELLKWKLNDEGKGKPHVNVSK